MAGEEGAAEQVGPDRHPVIAELIAVGADADQRGFFREERQLIGVVRAGRDWRCLGMMSGEV
jgi:excinuclease UvrABC helicase subunit UvrB